MARESEIRQSSLFSKADIDRIAQRLGLGAATAGPLRGRAVEDLIEVMRTEGYLLLKGPRLYQLQTGNY